MSEYAHKECTPYKDAIAPVDIEELATNLRKLGGGWRIINTHHLENEYKFKNFRQGLDFAVSVGELAGVLGHHPDIHLAWGKVRIEIWTHKINGLTECDFILAAKIDKIYGEGYPNLSSPGNTA